MFEESAVANVGREKTARKSVDGIKATKLTRLSEHHEF